MAVVLFILWALFIASYIVARILFPNEGRAKYKKRKKKYDSDGFDSNGFSALGFYRDGTRYDSNGLDRNGNPRPDGERAGLNAFKPADTEINSSQSRLS